MITASTQGINVTCEVLSALLWLQILFVVWVSYRRDETADCTTHGHFDFSEELTEEKQDGNTVLDETQTHKQWIGREGK